MKPTMMYQMMCNIESFALKLWIWAPRLQLPDYSMEQLHAFLPIPLPQPHRSDLATSPILF